MRRAAAMIGIAARAPDTMSRVFAGAQGRGMITRMYRALAART